MAQTVHIQIVTDVACPWPEVSLKVNVRVGRTAGMLCISSCVYLWANPSLPREPPQPAKPVVLRAMVFISQSSP